MGTREAIARASRRNVIAAIGAAPLMAQGDFAKAALADPVLVLCAHPLRRREALMGAWSDHELTDSRWIIEWKVETCAETQFEHHTRCARPLSAVACQPESMSVSL